MNDHPMIDGRPLTAHEALQRAVAVVDARNNSGVDDTTRPELPLEPEPDATCEHCGSPFERRKRSGGKPHKYCSKACKDEFNAQRSQRSPTCSEETPAVAVPVPKSETPAPAVTPKDDGEFDWHTDDSVLLREQPETAVYWNQYNDLVIRQHSWPDDDACVRISQNNLMTFIDKLCDLAGIGSVGRS